MTTIKNTLSHHSEILIYLFSICSLCSFEVREELLECSYCSILTIIFKLLAILDCHYGWEGGSFEILFYKAPVDVYSIFSKLNAL